MSRWLFWVLRIDDGSVESAKLRVQVRGVLDENIEHRILAIKKERLPAQALECTGYDVGLLPETVTDSCDAGQPSFQNF